MRQKHNPQLSLFMTVNNTQLGKELEQMSRILDDTPGLLQVVFDDLVQNQTGQYRSTGIDCRAGITLCRSEAIPAAQL